MLSGPLSPWESQLCLSRACSREEGPTNSEDFRSQACELSFEHPEELSRVPSSEPGPPHRPRISPLSLASTQMLNQRQYQPWARPSRAPSGLNRTEPSLFPGRAGVLWDGAGGLPGAKQRKGVGPPCPPTAWGSSPKHCSLHLDSAWRLQNTHCLLLLATSD